MLCNLQYLDLSNNFIKKIPESIATLHLRKVALSGNPRLDYSSALRTLSRIPSLEDVSLANCAIDSLPSVIQTAQSISTLDLSDNYFTEIEKTVDLISKLKNLRTLKLERCKIKIIPRNFKKLSYLKVLHLEGNGFSVEQQNQLKALLPECKLFFIGNEDHFEIQ
jgi:Leucine-rich repeat (LRR) protein